MQEHDGQPLERRPLEQAGHPLADDGAHAAAHEPERETGERDRTAVDPAAADADGFAQPGVALGAGEALRVRLAVVESERVGRSDVLVPHLELRVVEQEPRPIVHRHGVVMTARAADAEARLELFDREDGAAAGALAEKPASDRALLGVGRLSGGAFGKRHAERKA